MNGSNGEEIFDGGGSPGTLLYRLTRDVRPDPGERSGSCTAPAPGKPCDPGRWPTQSVNEAPGQLYPMLKKAIFDVGSPVFCPYLAPAYR